MIIRRPRTEGVIVHYGTPRHSGRYPYGSGGGDNIARNRTFLTMVEDMQKKGYTPTEIAKSFGMTTTELRARRSIAVNEKKAEMVRQARELRDQGLSNSEIGRQMGGINESTIRGYLAEGVAEKADSLPAIAAMLKEQVDRKTYVDIGAGVENSLGISAEKLNTAAQILKEQGYEVHPVQTPQVGNPGKFTTHKVLSPPGTTYRDAANNRENIQQIKDFRDDSGRSVLNMHPPLKIDPKRIGVNYAEDGGAESDGVIFVRPDVPDVSIGKNHYAQVRIAVGDKHYLKGMAVYKDDLPPGVDLVFNTNKSNTGNKLDALKKMKTKDLLDEVDEDNPFGSIVQQMIEIGPDGKERVTSAMNMVGGKPGAGAEGSWEKWNKSLPSQLLSKQSPKLARQQLGKTYETKKAELEEIKKLTNPVVRKKLLEAYADGADASAVHLRAAALPRQATQVILPVNSLKPTEIYAPNFKNGERVALVRFPHGGTFEIPELIVNNNHKPAIKLIGEQAKDAVGINHKVAERLSGADFDGDTVLVIPNGNGQIKSTPALAKLKGFDAKKEYGPYDGMKTMAGGIWDAKTKSEVFPPGKKPSGRNKATEMGKVSNLITDMTIKGAGPDELVRAVKHSMVVIDAEKHHLDYKRSAEVNGIRALSKKYQPDSTQGGASTIISRAKGRIDVPDAKLRSPKDGGPIDPRTGKLVYQPAPTWVNAKGKTVTKMRTSKKLAETDDAFTLVGDKDHPIERAYAEHSNRMKQLANEARIEVAAFKPPRMNPSAKAAYKSEVQSLNRKLHAARLNKPLERQAQVFANATVTQRRQANPDMDPADLKKIRAQALAAARARTEAKKQKIVPTPAEWAAIQAGAVSYNQLTQILQNADMDAIRELATPRPKVLMDSSAKAQADSLLARGYTQAEVAQHLGVSLTTLKGGLD